MTFWPLTNSDLPTNKTVHQFYDLDTELDLHQIMSVFHGAFATGVACQQETLTLPDTWFCPPFGTCLCSNCWDQILELAMSILDFSPWIILGTSSIFLLCLLCSNLTESILSKIDRKEVCNLLYQEQDIASYIDQQPPFDDVLLPKFSITKQVSSK